MLFNSMVFVWFLAVMLALYYTLPRNWTRILLLIGSYVFYGWWDWRFLGLIVLSTFVDYSAALMMPLSSQRVKKRWLGFSVVTNLGMLGVFKYFNFFAQSLSGLLSLLGLHIETATLSVILPVGISFYTFQTMSYTIDVYRGDLEPEHDFWTFATFVAFFPQLVAGPIERAGHLLPQLHVRPTIKRGNIPMALWYILWGYFLKVFMADNLAPVVESIYSNIETLTAFDVIICHYAFAFQIFGDFAGYSYIAVGVAELFGVSLIQNFEFPYFVKTPSEFWRNWHISLSRWLKDYLYIPLGGNRCGSAMVYRNLMITMLLGGLWHGAAWNFVLWGGYQGLLLIVFRLWSSDGRKSFAPWLPAYTKVFIMFNMSCFGWLLFRAPNMHSIVLMLEKLGCYTNLYNMRTYYWLTVSGFYIAVPLFIHFMQFIYDRPHMLPFKSAVMNVYCCVAVIFLLICMGSWGTKSFIYFQF